MNQHKKLATLFNRIQIQISVYLPKEVAIFPSKFKLASGRQAGVYTFKSI